MSVCRMDIGKLHQLENGADGVCSVEIIVHGLVEPLAVAVEGVCQSGFCGPKVLEIIARELNMNPVDVLLDKEGSYILTGKTAKGEDR